MIRTLHGLTFHVTAPSCWELVHTWPDVRVVLFYSDRQWHIRYSDATHGVTRSFATRDKAVELLACRRQTG